MISTITEFKCPVCKKIWIVKHDGSGYGNFVEMSHQVGFKMHMLMEHGTRITYVKDDGSRSQGRRTL